MQIKNFKGQVIGVDKKAKHTEVTTQERIYNFLVEFIKNNGYSPSIREICAGTYLSSTSSVYHHLETLKLMGMIDMKENTTRSIRLVGYEFRKVEN